MSAAILYLVTTKSSAIVFSASSLSAMSSSICSHVISQKREVNRTPQMNQWPLRIKWACWGICNCHCCLDSERCGRVFRSSRITVIRYLDSSKWQLKFTRIPVWTTWNGAPLMNIYSDSKGALCSFDGARHQDILTDRPSVAKWLWLCALFQENY
jgi:hypothetical protein